jgi:hypothetical protein
MMPGLEEEDEEATGDAEYEDHFGPELTLVTGEDATNTEADPLSPLSPMAEDDGNPLDGTASADAIKGSGQPLTAEALAKLSEEEAVNDAQGGDRGILPTDGKIKKTSAVDHM